MADDEKEAVAEIWQEQPRKRLEERLRIDYKPWHKPRKHYIRMQQWCREADKLVKLLNLREGQELRYFGLPGEDMLDLSVLGKVCTKASLWLRYIGFDSTRQSATSNLASHRVNSANYVHASSVVLPDPLTSLLNKQTPGFKQTEDNAPYHIVNLDFCNSAWYRSDEQYQNMNVIRSICDIQNRRGSNPWIIFLTFRVLRDGMNEDTLRQMFHCIIENLNRGYRFTSELKEALSIEGDEIRNAKDASSFDAQRWAHCQTLAFAKWLLTYLTSIDSTVTMLDSYIYNVARGQKDMVSLGFKITPNRPTGNDPSGVTSVPTAQQVAKPKEEDLACKMLTKIAAMADVDSILEDSPDLFEECLKLQASLLEGVGYDPIGYREWALGAELFSG